MVDAQEYVGLCLARSFIVEVSPDASNDVSFVGRCQRHNDASKVALGAAMKTSPRFATEKV
jgi:hypothetical protein